MTRTNIADVREIYDPDDADDASIQAHIDAAAVLVDDIAAAGNLTTGRLETIERYVAAHFIQLQFPRLKSEEVGSHVERYQTDNTYLDTAIMLDTTNTLDQDAPAEANVYVPEGR